MSVPGWKCSVLGALVALSGAIGQAQHAASERQFYGFDQNIYPGDAALPALRKSMAFAGYWLNVPPGARTNSWRGKRATLVQQGFGFLVLFNGRLEAGLKRVDAPALGKADGEAAVRAAEREGFPASALIFLDVEEGGRMTPKQASYFAAWVTAVRASRYLPGVYCSGIAVDDEPGVKISTADDIRARDKAVALWVANDACPPSPGCVVGKPGVAMADSGRLDALVWQFTQSPLRPEFALKCKATYAPDRNCYAPGTLHHGASFLDLNLSPSSDPSAGR